MICGKLISKHLKRRKTTNNGRCFVIGFLKWGLDRNIKDSRKLFNLRNLDDGLIQHKSCDGFRLFISL